MGWTRHVDGGERVVWLDESTPVARGIAADAHGVHPRLDQRDHLDHTCLATSYDVERYLDERAPDDVAGELLIAASLVAHHLRLARTTAAPAA